MGSLVSPQPALTQEGINSSSVTSCHMPGAGRSLPPAGGTAVPGRGRDGQGGTPSLLHFHHRGHPTGLEQLLGDIPGSRLSPSVSLPRGHRPHPSVGTELRWLYHAHPPPVWGPCTPWEPTASSRCLPGDLKGISDPKAEQKGKCVPIPPLPRPHALHGQKWSLRSRAALKIPEP